MSEQKKYLSAEEIFAEEEQEELRREQKRLADLHDSEEGSLKTSSPATPGRRCVVYGMRRQTSAGGL